MKTRRAGAMLSALLYAQCLFGLVAVGAVLYKHAGDGAAPGVVQATLPAAVG